MLDLLRNIALAGLGIITLKEEKAKEIVNELIAQGQFSKEEGNQFLKEVIERIERNRNELERKVGEILRHTLEKMNIPTKEEIACLEKKQDEMLRRIEQLEREGEGGEKNPCCG